MTPEQQAIFDDIHLQVDEGRLRLPSFPRNLIKIRMALNDPNISIEQLTRIVHHDATLVNRFYSLARSAAFSLDTENLTLFRILRMLGLNTIRSIVYNYCLSQLYSARKLKKVEELSLFVRNRSLEIAGLNYSVSKIFELEDAPTALLCGLLHNVGALVIISWLANTTEVSLTLKEQKTLVVMGQQDFTERVAASWELPTSIQQAVVAKASDSQAASYLHIMEVSRWLSRVYRNSSQVNSMPHDAITGLKLDPDHLLTSKNDIMAEMIRVIQTIR
ncbi:HDOD domain-containing protein [Pleionea mediterranea]|uniref:HD-like signal output (HDOD) protein n=1 Tax=Pleionea mediterranea TaxID=523701 RepID=A0A316G018_9GAMM|nr:HDOD domain-containing protein [Pleionea mediterranea]PWK53306.1 HD-like signal output (HDOD) protein [Pleionea mediterranea]